ncbi:MAG: ABC transporter ATP-binding protein [Candidatus Paceibacterota bacterium]
MEIKEEKNNITFWQVLSKMKEMYRPFLGVIVLIFGFLFLGQAVALIGPYIYGKIIDGIVQGEEIFYLIKLCLLSFGILLFNNLIVSYYEEKIKVLRFDFDVHRRITKETLEKLFAFSIGQHENQNSGIKKSIIDRGQNALTELAFSLIYEIFPMILQVTVTIIALTIIAPPLGLIILLGVFIYFYASFYSSRVFGKDFRDLQEMYVEAEKKQSEFLRNASLVKINANESEVVNDYDKKLEKVNTFGKKIWLRFIRFFQIRSTISDTTRIIVLLVGIYLVYRQVYTPGFLVIILSWSSNAFDRIIRAGYLQRRITELYAMIKIYFDLLNLEPAIKEKENPVILEKIKGNIDYKNVFFRYPSREEPSEVTNNLKTSKIKSSEHTLKNVNISIKAGEKIAIVGHSGAGKSSLVQLLLRAYDPLKGKILIDGYDLKDLSLKKYRNFLGVVPQDVSLFDNTLRYNILFGSKKEISEKQLNQAIKMAGIDSFLKNLENGLETMLGERGVKLSGGEKQRVGIARALVKNPAILVFDEATSSLDVENEALIQESIKKASQGRTTIIIAHRLSTIKNADKIIVLEKGRVIGEGKHEHLIKNCLSYKKMINIQSIMIG